MPVEVWIEHNLEEVSDELVLMGKDIPESVLIPIATKLGREARRLFRGTVRTWRRKPIFDMDVDVGRDRVTVLVGTDSEIYGWTDVGTAAHPIVAVNAPSLAFPATSTPKTSPGSLKSGPGNKSPTIVLRKRVMHPGGRARRFSEKVFGLVDRMALRELNKVVDKWLRKHSD